jgi:hypothetical protein
MEVGKSNRYQCRVVGQSVYQCLSPYLLLLLTSHSFVVLWFLWCLWFFGRLLWCLETLAGLGGGAVGYSAVRGSAGYCGISGRTLRKAGLPVQLCDRSRAWRRTVQTITELVHSRVKAEYALYCKERKAQ